MELLCASGAVKQGILVINIKVISTFAYIANKRFVKNHVVAFGLYTHL